MAHFAKINSDTKKVIEVLTLNNSDMLNADGVEDETVGQQYLETHNNWPANLWIQTSCNTRGNTHISGGTPFRGNYAGIDSIWDEDNQIFWLPKPYASWVTNLSTANWESPIGPEPALTTEQQNELYIGTHLWEYIWDEDNQTWNLTDLKDIT